MLYNGASEERMETAELTVQLPKSEIAFIEQYAAQHGLTVAELINRYIQHLQLLEKYPIHPEIEKISGVIPDAPDAETDYYEGMLVKHQ